MSFRTSDSEADETNRMMSSQHSSSIIIRASDPGICPSLMPPRPACNSSTCSRNGMLDEQCTTSTTSVRSILQSKTSMRRQSTPPIATPPTTSSLSSSNNNNGHIHHQQQQQQRQRQQQRIRRGIANSKERLLTEDWPKLEVHDLNRDTPLIGIASASDTKDIENLANSVSLTHIVNNNNQKQSITSSSKSSKTSDNTSTTANIMDILQNEGFLVSGYKSYEYSKFVQSSEHFFTLRIKKELVGFLLAYGSEQIKPDEELNNYVKDKLSNNKKFVLIKQICIHPSYRKYGYGKLLYSELYARILHYYEHESSDSRPIYTAIVKDPPNVVSIQFHKRCGFQYVQDYIPQIDNKPRHIYCNSNVSESLQSLTMPTHHNISTAPMIVGDSNPFYDSLAMTDPHCIGVGISLYVIKPPDVDGSFYADVRVMLKWRQPGIEKLYKHPREYDKNNKDDNDNNDDNDNETATRTPIDLDRKGLKRTDYRIPRYSLNKLDAVTIEYYAYIDRDDPYDVITLQQVLRGTFCGHTVNLKDFPVDTQRLRFKFRIWDSDPNDRCRYLRQLHFVDGTPWQKCVKSPIRSPTVTFLVNRACVGVDDVAQTSYYAIDIPCIRNARYYMRIVAMPLLFISSLSLTSVAATYDDGDFVNLNAALLLTVVAFLFLTKDETPKCADTTKLDYILYGAFLSPWSLIVFQYVAMRLDLSETATDRGGWVVASIPLMFIIGTMFYIYWKYSKTHRENSTLGDMNYK